MLLGHNQGRAKWGTFSRDQTEHIGVLVTWRVAPRLFWGNVKASGTYEDLKIYNTVVLFTRGYGV